MANADSERANTEELSVLIANEGGERERDENDPKERSYDLLEEEDSEEFETVEVSLIDDDIEGRSYMPVSGHRRAKERVRKLHKLSARRKKLPPAEVDISQLTTDEDHIPVPVNEPDASLPSDMLLSLVPRSGGIVDESSPSISPSEPLEILSPVDEETAQQARRARVDSLSAEERQFEDEDVDSPAWAQHRKHIFILSISGKPVYSRYGKEDKLVNLFGIMQALISFVQDDKDSLRSVVAGEHKIVFFSRPPLVFVAVSRTEQADSQLAHQLAYTHYQILSVLTNTQLQQIYDNRAGFDLRNLLQGSEKFIDNILNLTDRDPSYLFSGVRCLAMPVSVRQAVTTAILQSRTPDVLFALLVAKNQLITSVRHKDHHLHPVDIHLIFNLVDASMSFRSAESWTPICLPKWNDTGYLHAYVSYLPNNSSACLLLLSTNKERFFELKQCKEKIVEKLEKHGLLEMVDKAVENDRYNIDHLQCAEIRHFMYKARKTSAVTSPIIPALYSDEEDRLRLFDHYMYMYQHLHSHAWPTKILYHVGPKEALLGWRTSNFDLYLVFDPLISKPQAIVLGNKLIRWISKEEDRLIVTSIITF